MYFGYVFIETPKIERLSFGPFSKKGEDFFDVAIIKIPKNIHPLVNLDTIT
jgi:hypothetical protein